MVFPKARLVVSACLLVLWLAFLAYLVVQTRAPVILSRPQFLVADAYVIAEVQACGAWPCPEVDVAEVAWTRPGAAAPQVKRKIRVEGLADCGPSHGWTRPRTYILALSQLKEGGFQVAVLPSTPGYLPAFKTIELLSAGKEPDRVARLMKAHLAGLSEEQIQKMINQTPVVVKRNVPFAEADRFEEALRKTGARVHLEAGEARIYPATAAARRQLEDIVAERRP